jgi:hypothetical protein
MSAYSSIILGESSLVSYWKLDELSGTSAADSKGSNTGTYSGSYTQGATGIVGDGGHAVQFGGGIGSVSVPDVANLRFTSSGFSLEGWIKQTGKGGVTGGGFILAKYNSGGGFPGYAVKTVGTGGPVNFYIGSWVTGSTNLASVTNWYHVVCTYSGTSWKIYLNGALDNSGTAASNLASTVALTIGLDSLNNGCNGTLDEVAVYNAALSAGQVLTHYQAGIGALFAYSPVGLNSGVINSGSVVRSAYQLTLRQPGGSSGLSSPG